MFGFGNASRQKKIDEKLKPLLESIQAMNSNERAAIIMLTKVQLLVVAEVYGNEIVKNPLHNKLMITAILDEMMELYSLAESVLENCPQNFVRYLRIHAYSILSVISTMSVGMDVKKYRPGAVSLWKLLWTSRDQSETTLVWLRKGEIAIGSPCFPLVNRRRLSDLEILKLTENLPVFLTRKKPVTKV